MKQSLIILLFVLAALPLRAQSAVLINELMQSNIDCLMDDQNEYPDSWVELYNAGTEAVNLNAYRLGITRRSSEAYSLPSYTLGAGQRVVIYCDKESTGLHTGFRLESGNKCAVYLYRGSAFADSVSGLQKQPAPNIAYGRTTDGASSWGYQAVPTPGEANCGTVYTACLGEPVFSAQGRIFSQPGASVGLSITAPADAPAGTVVRFTTDGSEPTAESPVWSGTSHFSTTRLIRARLFCDGYLSPRSTTHSYIFLGREQTLPVISIVGNNDDLYGDRKGILVRGNYNSSKENYNYNWRRPINFEYFENADEDSRLNQLCEARICGNASRGNALKSLGLYAHKRFGTKHFRYEFFPEDRPGQDNFKSILLRNAGNDFDYLYMRDAIIQRAMGRYADLDWQAYRPAIVYINGVYKGILNIRERANEDNVYTNYDGLEDITMMENNWHLQAGSWNTWQSFIDFCHTKGHTLAEYEQVMNVTEYLNVMIMELFFNNQDFPGNNIVYWRPNQGTPELPAKWRLLVKDTDFGLGLYGGKYTADYNTIAWINNADYDADRTWGNTWEYTRMFRYAMQNDDFQRLFCDRAAIYMGDFLNYQRIWDDIWQKMYNDIHVEYRSYHRPMFNQWWPSYPDELYAAKQWLMLRPAEFIKQIANQYGLGSPRTLTVNTGLTVADTTGLHVSFNGVDLTTPVWNGSFYADRSITLSAALDDADRRVSGWDIRYTDRYSKLHTETLTGATVQFTVPSGTQSFTVNAVIDRASSLDMLDLTEESPEVRKFVLDGRLYIERNGAIFDALGRRIH